MMINLTMFRKALALIITFALTFVFLTSVVSAQDQSSSLNFTVDHIATTPEKILEKVNLFFRFSKEAKVDYYDYLLEKRLAELSYAVKSNNNDLIEPTASRYSTYIGVMTQYMISSNVASKKDQIISTYARHEKILLELQSKFEHDSGWWLAIQNDINSTKDFSTKLSNSW